jgi:hypothetical protein
VRAPARSEHTREVAKEILGLSDDTIDKLIENGDLELGLTAESGAFKQQIKTKFIGMAVSALMKYQELKSKLA